MNKRGIVKGLMVFLLFGMAIALTMYPFISNWLFENKTDSVADAVEQAAQELDNSEQQAALQAAREYNQVLADGHVTLTDPFEEDKSQQDLAEYESLLNLTNDGVMGTVEIPAIDVSLPIYHGTSESVLEKGVGHLHGTSLPVGGESTHTVLTGHTGLSKAKLFTDLTEVEEGDIFFLHVMGENLAYQVDQIKVVLPSELDDLKIVPGEDYCTLVTCTPYGVNSHRLLVRGVRTDYQEAVENPETFEDKEVTSKWMEEYKKAVIISISCFVAILSVIGIVRHFRNRSRS
ncbi:class C sortase [Sellimonas catena]|uniref:Class C sortase n=1 Tax=Sellimonas catena TaxID=2994035 RepID=A0A9W6C8Y8_9FIRM|nr:class C sortase [Sellimonas catena]GLG05884.1 class C sortase [Sellimonas catena]GLG88861.1 class C sortase [Sellimonas catena]